ncbi:MAG: DUF4846 domain-containing protein [Puia sp.]|nr:DUF4846 domain-containing protein [Puia sp.]
MLILCGPASFTRCRSQLPCVAGIPSPGVLAENPAAGLNPYASIGAIPTPPGYSRLSGVEPADPGKLANSVPSSDGGRPAGSRMPKLSFGEWLRSIPLKKDKTVYLYDGSRKQNQSAQFAVLDISVGKEDLQQCADAVMRLRAGYL